MPHRGEDVAVSGLTEEAVLQFAKAAASAFGVGASESYPFDKTTAEKWLDLKKEDQDKRRRNGPMTTQFQSAKGGKS